MGYARRINTNMKILNKIDHPYLFGNISKLDLRINSPDFGEDLKEVVMLKQDISCIKQTYRKLLNCIAQNDFSSLKEELNIRFWEELTN
jgi:hypothetical protein